MAKKASWEQFLDVVKISPDLVGADFNFIYTFGPSYPHKIVSFDGDSQVGFRWGTTEDGEDDHSIIVVPIDPIAITGDPFYHRSIAVQRAFELFDPDFPQGVRRKIVKESIEPTTSSEIESAVLMCAIRGQSGKVSFSDLDDAQRQELLRPLTEKVQQTVDKVESMTLSIDLETGNLILTQNE